MTDNLPAHAAVPDDAQFIADALTKGYLHQVFMICPDAHQHIELTDNQQFTFGENFLPHFNQYLEQQPVYFHDDNPLDYHRFSRPGNIMLAALLPPEKIISVDGRLSVRKVNLKLADILGAYLFNNSQQFYRNMDFDLQSLKKTIN